MRDSYPKFSHLSEMLGKKVLSLNGLVLGKISDLMVDLDLKQPEVVKLVYRAPWSKERWCIPWSNVTLLAANQVALGADVDPILLPSKESRQPSQILLRDFLLDKQIVDINGAKVERVNDLCFITTWGGRLRLTHVDVGFRGLLRRLGFEDHVVRFCNWFFDYRLQDRLIAWDYTQPLADPDRLRLQIAQSELVKLHPADLADIIEDMDVNERAAVVESLNTEVLADALEEMDPKVQVSIMRGLKPEKAADIIEEMSPDEAADLMADLPRETATVIFRELDETYGQQVKDLLAHDEDEAGGLMTTEFVMLPPDKTIVDALAYIKQHAEEIDVIYYIYVVDSELNLMGVATLKELLTNDIFTPLNRIMTSRVITAKLDDDAQYLADLFAKYAFRAIPVVDDMNRIQGVIRFKALLELVAPYLGK